MGIIFPVYASFFVEFKPGMKTWFNIGCIGAGLFVGAFSYAIVHFAILKIIKLLATKLHGIAEGQGDLTTRLECESNDQIGDLAKWFNAFVANLQSIILQIRKSAFHIETVSQRINETANEIETGSMNQETHLADVNTSISLINQRIANTTENSNQTAGYTEKANSAATSGLESIGHTNEEISHIADLLNKASEHVKNLSEQSHAIDEAIRMIEDVADQTNLLALNANIEAARAGEAGRGFVVVADQVRALASRTVKTTSDIDSLIRNIQEKTQATVTVMKEATSQFQTCQQKARAAKDDLQLISETIGNVDRAVSEIADSSNQQLADSQEIGHNIEGIFNVSKNAANGAKQMAGSAHQLQSQVETLNKLIGRFKVADEAQPNTTMTESKNHTFLKPELSDSYVETVSSSTLDNSGDPGTNHH